MKIRIWLGVLLWSSLWGIGGGLVGAPSVMAEAPSTANPVQETVLPDAVSGSVSVGEGWVNDALSNDASDLRFIFDVSGSMRRNDPEMLSVSSLELLAALLPTGVRAGIWTFGERIDNPLPLARVDRRWREKARALEPALSQYQQFTDIEGAIRQASSVPGSGQRHIILLTDGMIDLFAAGGDKRQRDQRSRQTLLEELAPSLADRDVVVYAIAFSDDADLDLVERLAQATGGLAAKAQNPEDLLRVFLTIIDRLFPADQVPLQEGRFTIDSQVEAFSALLFHAPQAKPPTLIAPDGSRYTRDDHPRNMRWQEEPRFELISVPSPQRGEWQLEGEVESGSRIQVESSLTLHIGELPNTLYLGFPLTLSAWFEKGGTPLDRQAMSANLSMRAMLRNAEGDIQASTSLSRSDEGFSGTLPAPVQPGNARLVVEAQGDRLYRQRVLAVNVSTPIGVVLDRRRQRVELDAQHPRLNSANTRIEARLQGRELSVSSRGKGRWRIALPDLDPTYRLPLKLRAVVTLDGQSRKIVLPDVLLNAAGKIGLDAAGLEESGLITQALERKRDASQDADSGGAAARAQELWKDSVVPRVERLARRLGVDPSVLRPWMLVLALLGLVALLVMITMLRPRQRRRHSPRREEPHV